MKRYVLTIVFLIVFFGQRPEVFAYVRSLPPLAVNSPCGYITVSTSESPSCPRLASLTQFYPTPTIIIFRPGETNNVATYSNTYTLSNTDAQPHTVVYNTWSAHCDSPYGDPTYTGSTWWFVCNDRSQPLEGRSITIPAHGSVDVVVSRAGTYTPQACGSFQLDLSISSVDGETACNKIGIPLEDYAWGFCQTGVDQCLSTITATPFPTQTPAPTLTPTITPLPPTTTPPVPTPTRTPAKCACDSPIEFQIEGSPPNTGPILKGQKVTFKVWGKVDPNNPPGNDAEIVQMTFHLQKKIDNQWQDYVDPKTNQPVRQVVSKTTNPSIQGPVTRPGRIDNLRYYFGTWPYTIPADLAQGVYRVIVPTDKQDAQDFVCQYRTATVSQQTGFFASFFRWLNRFSGATSSPEPTPTSALHILAPSGQVIKLGTFDPFAPTPYLQRGCTQLEFGI